MLNFLVVLAKLLGSVNFTENVYSKIKLFFHFNDSARNSRLLDISWWNYHNFYNANGCLMYLFSAHCHYRLLEISWWNQEWMAVATTVWLLIFFL